MAKFDEAQSKATDPTSVLSIIGLATGIFGWVLAIFIMLTSFTALSTYFSFGRTAGMVLILLPGFSWLTGIVTGIIGVRQSKRIGDQQGDRLGKSGIILGGVGCALFYGLLVVIAVGFYLVWQG